MSKGASPGNGGLQAGVAGGRSGGWIRIAFMSGGVGIVESVRVRVVTVAVVAV